MRYVVTGARGWLGWHARARLALEPSAQVVAVGRGGFDPARLAAAVADCDVVLHLAGINRGPEEDLDAGNVALTDALVEALRTGGATPVVVYAGSTYADAGHPGCDTAYARGKREAGRRLRAWAQAAGDPARAVEVRFTGLFGEHGRPDYNSFVATFADRVVRGATPQVLDDRELPLLHVGDAVGALLAAARESVTGILHPPGHPVAISAVSATLRRFHDTYADTGDIPALAGPLDVALFNTLRAAMWPHAYPFRPVPRTDARGSLVETIRVHGGTGQAFVSTTNPGFIRGDHVHTTKIERFQVLSGTGLIRLRRLLHEEVLQFPVTGEQPAILDMPTLWTHSIENVGHTPLVTAFWTNELLDPDRPDTYPVGVLTGTDRP